MLASFDNLSERKKSSCLNTITAAVSELPEDLRYQAVFGTFVDFLSRDVVESLLASGDGKKLISTIFSERVECLLPVEK